LLSNGVADCTTGPERLSTPSISADEGRRGKFSSADLSSKLRDRQRLGRTQGKGSKTFNSLNVMRQERTVARNAKVPISGAD
jgi:hypothetical protein